MTIRSQIIMAALVVCLLISGIANVHFLNPSPPPPPPDIQFRADVYENGMWLDRPEAEKLFQGMDSWAKYIEGLRKRLGAKD